MAASEGKYDEAVRQYNTVRHLRKYDEEIVFSTVQALISGGKKKEARDILDSVLRSDSDHPEANYLMAAANEDKSRTEE
ncbi:MAG TPA: tetratricopeptide repeat protein [Leptospiraceae bacterium]|nr:tetratricopeptide repeat protein [Leptospiraceae bacterium]